MSNTISVRASNLTGAALDWAVAMAEGYTQDSEDRACVISPQGEPMSVSARGAALGYGYRPSSSWEHGGPVFDKHRGGCQWNAHMGGSDSSYWAGPGNTVRWHYGPTALIAFCRALVHAKLGEFVQVPSELMQ